MTILETLNINPTFFAQIINFVLLLILLKVLLYKPMQKILQERKNTIDQSLQKAKDIDKRLEKFAIEERQQMEQVQNKVQTLLKNAEDRAKIQAEQIITSAKEKGETLLKEYQISLNQKQVQFEKDLTQKVYDLSQEVVKNLVSENEQLQKDSVSKVISQLANVK